MNIVSIVDKLRRAIIIGDENISLKARSTCFIPTMPSVVLRGLLVTRLADFRGLFKLDLAGFCGEFGKVSIVVSAISTARRQISRQRRASPETAAT